MKTRIHHLITRLALAVLLLSTLNLQLSTAHAQGTAFTYQGRLNNGANPANGIYDLRFTIYDLSAGGGQQGGALTNSPTTITNGLFTVTLDFGNQFPGADRWLEIGVRTNGGGGFSALSPRQPLTPSPYAIFAGTASNLSGTLSSASVPGTYGNAVVLSNAANQISGTFTGNGANVAGVNAATLNGVAATGFWQLGGNNVSPGQFLGSTNNQAVEIRVNGLRALRLATDAFGFDAPNVIGGSSLNYIAPGTVGSVIPGGGAVGYAFFPETNSIYADFSSIGGGFINQIQSNAFHSVIAGGEVNQIQLNGFAAVIGGGAYNQIGANAKFATVAGGYSNVISQSATNAFIGGGDNNTISPFAINATIAGGSKNTATSYFDTISGGSSNTINGIFGFIGGGQSNTVAYPFTHDVIAGGVNNTAGGYFAVIGGGSGNRTAEQGAVVGGGEMNLASGFESSVVGGGGNQATATSSFIGGGANNTASGNSSTVGGGVQNLASGKYSTIPGGNLNAATGTNSFAAGQQAKALHNGAFVWSDSQNSAFISTATNQFLIRASGGVGINTNNPKATLDVNGSLRVGSGTTIINNLQAGIAQMASDSATVKTNFTFTFPKAYATVPKVLVSALSASDVDDTFAVTVRRVTTTTCTVNVVRTDIAAGWGQHVQVTWMAWE